MAKKSGSGSRRERQYVAVVNCAECGTEVVKRSHRQRYCKACLPIALARAARRRDPGYRHQNGESFLGEPFSCVECNQSSPRKSGTQKRCSECRIKSKRRAVAASFDKNKHKYGIAEPVVGLPHSCIRCDVVFTRTGTYQIMCQECVPIAKREYALKYARKNYAQFSSVPKFRVNARMASHIRDALKRKKAGRRWERIVGYTLLDLMAHLASKFLPGMTWENISEWHIDHIKPKRLFKFDSDGDPEFRACWALENLQPLWARDNLSKGGRYVVNCTEVAA